MSKPIADDPSTWTSKPVERNIPQRGEAPSGRTPPSNAGPHGWDVIDTSTDDHTLADYHHLRAILTRIARASLEDVIRREAMDALRNTPKDGYPV